MKKTPALFGLIIVLALSACATQVTASPVPPPTIKPAESVTTQIPAAISTIKTEQSPNQKQYTNSTFGLSFQYPSNWFGPSEYVSDGTLRVEIGSDTVYPYGEQPEQPSSIKNSYSVVIQYTKNNQNSYWKDTYQSLLNMKDGESLSNARSLLIRVRQLNIGRFIGFEYITTLSETARTDHVYGRSIMAFDGKTNDLLTIMGQPNNVEIPNGTAWRDVYQTIDEANKIFFLEIVESMTIK